MITTLNFNPNNEVKLQYFLKCFESSLHSQEPLQSAAGNPSGSDHARLFLSSGWRGWNLPVEAVTSYPRGWWVCGGLSGAAGTWPPLHRELPGRRSSCWGSGNSRTAGWAAPSCGTAACSCGTQLQGAKADCKIHLTCRQLVLQPTGPLAKPDNRIPFLSFLQGEG